MKTSGGCKGRKWRKGQVVGPRRRRKVEGKEMAERGVKARGMTWEGMENKAESRRGGEIH